MGCSFPSTIFGIKSRRLALCCAIFELWIHLILLIWCVYFVANAYAESVVIKGGDDLVQFTNRTNTTGRFHDELEDFKGYLETFFLTEDDGYAVLLSLIIHYEVICIPSILILFCSLRSRIKCLAFPWMIKAVFEKLVLLAVFIFVVWAELPLLSLLLLLFNCYEVFVLFVVPSGIFSVNSVDLQGPGYMPPGSVAFNMY